MFKPISGNVAPLAHPPPLGLQVGHDILAGKSPSDSALHSLQQRASHNIKALDLIASSWLAAIQLCFTGSISGQPLDRSSVLYSLVPDLSDGTVHEDHGVAFECLSKVSIGWFIQISEPVC